MSKEPKDIKAIFSEALEKQTTEERAAYLDEACGNDDDLRSKVEALLKAHNEAGDFLEVPARGQDVTVEESPSIEGPGTMIGRYELLELIGEGGMGLIYLAEQKKPVRRRVALKIIKPGMDTKQVIARFEAERQALALLDHPNIAHVFDAGTTKAGRLYFVMEYVKGMSITKYCDEYKLSVEERLELFKEVCEGVHHAHQKGIIHRDIKPSNILVSIHGDRSVPKIIDFGIAKAITQPLTDKTFFTHEGQLLGTPEYMSPEQVDLATQDIDTRSDVYSLGVLLYVLLAGTLPFDRESLEKAGFAELQRTIREDEPPLPSTRLTSLGDKAKAIAENRRTHIITLTRRLHRELEWIPMKAMRKERTRRYRSASELADDIQNYLSGAPLIAGPETAIYRARKFVRKHAGSVATAALIAVVIILGLVVSIVMGCRAEQAREKEVTARKQVEQALVRAEEAERLAEERRAEAQAVTDFLNNDILRSVQMALIEDREVTGRYVFDAASENIEGKFEGEPLVEASIRETLGLIYLSLGEYKAAEPHLERALKIRGEQLGEEYPDTLRSMYSLAWMYMVKQGRYEEAEPLLIKVLDIRRRKLGEEHPDTLHSMNSLAWLYRSQGRYDESEALYVKALEISRRVLGEEHLDTLKSMNGLALMYMLEQGRYEEAEPLLIKLLDVRRRKLGEEHPDTLLSMRAMGWLYRSQGLYDESEALYVKALEISRRVLGEEHKDTLKSTHNLIWLYSKQERYEEAEALCVRMLDITRRKLGEEHPDTLESMGALIMLYFEHGRYDELEELAVKLVELSPGVLDELSPDVDALLGQYYQQGLYEELESLLVKVLEVSRRVLGEEHPSTVETLKKLIELYEAWGKPEKAEEWRTKLPRKQTPKE